ncbi:MAG: histidine kinase [Chitinophagales bacterium]|nr:histidine kinase [Chitinophagales bacterium]
MNRFLLLLTLCLSLSPLLAQKDSSAKSGRVRNPMVESAGKLKRAYETDDDAMKAAAYEQLGNEYLQKNDLPKAESYFEKAKSLYKQLGKKADVSRVALLLARTQEQQQKSTAAAANYEESAQQNETESQKDILSNNARRALSNDDAAVQQQLTLQNVQIARDAGDQAETVVQYEQLGDLQFRQNQFGDAALSYQNALLNSREPVQQLALNNRLAKSLFNMGHPDSAIRVQKKALENMQVQQNPALQISQIRELADLYARSRQGNEALRLLDSAYQLALRRRFTLEARNSLEQINTLLLARGDVNDALRRSRNFLGQLDSLVLADSTLRDERLVAETEARIEQLELEKALKDQLLRKQERFNSSLLLAAAVLGILLLVLARAWFAIRRKNRKIALQSLRREMNPHFVFNSLNSVNQFIAQNDELAANKYLSAYSQLMRYTMENSNRDFVSLSSELEMLRKYLDLERLRFPDQFEYHINIDENIDPDAELVPNMLIQPNLENAIWHGLRYIEGQGLLELSVQRRAGRLLLRVEDNGIGLERSRALKTRNQSQYSSRGLSNTRERIQLLNELYGKNIQFTLTEKNAPEQGVIVEIMC